MTRYVRGGAIEEVKRTIDGFSMSERAAPTRLILLDGLRGIAAFAVIFWHWQHFFFDGTTPRSFSTEDQPFYDVFAIFYREGWRAVPLFFALSGVIFFWLAEEKLASKKLSVVNFAVDRFSRIYPLYIITFVVAFFIQSVILKYTGHYLVYSYNDNYHAILNVLMVSAWGFEKGWSFNGPVWSISVEILLYITFAAGCLLGRIRYFYFLGLVLTGFLLPASAFKVASGLTQFYLAGLGFVVFKAAAMRFGSKARASFVLAATVCWALVALVPEWKKPLLDSVAFPTAIVALTAINLSVQIRSRICEWLGDISYSVYLWHFLLQGAFVLCVVRLGYSRDVFYNPLTMITFVVILAVLSVFSFLYIELPAKKFFRSKIGRRRETIAAPDTRSM